MIWPPTRPLIRHALCLLMSLTCLLAAGGKTDADKAGADKADIVIGVALPAQPMDDLLLEGVQLGADQINAAGGIAGRRLVLVAERPSLVDARDLLRRGASDRELALKMAAQRPLAVIGHYSWDGAVAASQIYQERRVLFFSTFLTSDMLTRHRFDLIFDMHRRLRMTSQAFAEYLVGRGLCRVLLLAEQSDFGTEAGLFFAEHAGARGLELSLSLSFPPDATDFQDILLFLLDTKALRVRDNDAILFIGKPDQAQAFIGHARRFGFAMPIAIPWASYGPQAHLVARDTKGPIAMQALMTDDVDTPVLRGFRDAFMAAHGREPSEFAATGFDAIRLIALAMEQTGSADPVVIARHLRTLVHTVPLDGATGPLAFNLDGERIQRPTRILEFLDGRATGSVAIADPQSNGDPAAAKCEAR